MKAFRYLSAMAVTAMLAVTAQAAVTITAPERPAVLDEELQAGKEYYLLNMGNGKFMNQKSGETYFAGWSDTPYAFRLDDAGEGLYAFWQGSGYIGDGSYVHWSYTTGVTTSYVNYDLQKNNVGYYKIKYVYQNSFIGYASNYSGYVYWNVSGTNDGSNWFILPTNLTFSLEALQLYYAKKRLYDAIVAADARGYYVKDYVDIYNDATKTYSEYNAVANEINNASSLSEQHSYLFPDWSDYPILITNLGNWVNYSSYNYLYRYTSKSDDGSTNTLKTSVYVDQPSTFSFIIDCNQRYTNAPTMPFQVFVDGELVYDFQGETKQYYYDSYLETSSNSYKPYGSWYNYNSRSIAYNRHFIDLQPGHHLIDIVTTNRYEGTSSIDTYFRQVGVEKTPTIEVNLVKEGSLGDEVLRAMDNNPLITETNIRNVRRLKISGKMGDADWNELYNMNMLTALDLSDANLTEIKTQQLSQFTHNSLEFLHELKLPKALKTIGREAFFGTYIEDVDIPETVDSIGDFAFSNTRLRVANIPNAKYVGHNAFRGCTMLNKAVMKSVQFMGINAFAECYNLSDLTLEVSIDKVPERAFYCCDEIVNLTIPETVKTIEAYAFYQNFKATFTIPSHVSSIGSYAFQEAWRDTGVETLNMPANANLGTNVFQGANINNVVFPDSYYSFSQSKMFADCSSLQSVKFLSPTMVTVPSDFFDGLTKKNLKILVPDFLRTTYMRDSYWMDFTIEGFRNTEMTDITINKNLVLSQHDRFEGNPNVSISSGVIFEVEGGAGMNINSLTMSSDLNNGSYSQIMTTTDQVAVAGDVTQRLYTAANKWYFLSLPFDCDLSKTVTENGCHYAIRYYDGEDRATKVYAYPESDHNYANNLTKENNLQSFSYPGASTLKIVFSQSTRTYNSSDVIHVLDASGTDHTNYGSIGAWTLTLEGDHFDIWMTTNAYDVSYGYSIDAIYADEVLVPGTLNSWKNYDCSKDVIPAGTGFIYMTSKDAWTQFHAVDNVIKARLFNSAENESNEFHYALKKNPCENKSNQGWNLVGNPYPNYYNNHKISFAAPITLWTGTTYKAYSLRDDDIAILPNQAIFVQCPEETSEISFPVAGRQLSSVITDQANSRPMSPVAEVIDRFIIDLELSDGSSVDETRVVLNDEAKLTYEMCVDAGKFMSMQNDVQQIYTIGNDNVQYAINERPEADGNVRLGMYIGSNKQYTISLKRCQAQNVILIDNETGESINLMEDSYTFEAKTGTYNNRFVLQVNTKQPTAIDSVDAAEAGDTLRYFDLSGRLVTTGSVPVQPGVYVVKGNGKSETVVVE